MYRCSYPWSFAINSYWFFCLEISPEKYISIGVPAHEKTIARQNFVQVWRHAENNLFHATLGQISVEVLHLEERRKAQGVHNYARTSLTYSVRYTLVCCCMCIFCIILSDYSLMVWS